MTPDLIKLVEQVFNKVFSKPSIVLYPEVMSEFEGGGGDPKHLLVYKQLVIFAVRYVL